MSIRNLHLIIYNIVTNIVFGILIPLFAAEIVFRALKKKCRPPKTTIWDIIEEGMEGDNRFYVVRFYDKMIELLD